MSNVCKIYHHKREKISSSEVTKSHPSPRASRTSNHCRLGFVALWETSSENPRGKYNTCREKSSRPTQLRKGEGGNLKLHYSPSVTLSTNTWQEGSLNGRRKWGSRCGAAPCSKNKRVKTRIWQATKKRQSIKLKMTERLNGFYTQNASKLRMLNAVSMNTSWWLTTEPHESLVRGNDKLRISERHQREWGRVRFRHKRL